MIEIPDPLPKDITALQELARALIQENKENHRRLEKMGEMLKVLEHLAEMKERGDG